MLTATKKEGVWFDLLICAYAQECNRYRIEQPRDAGDKDARHTTVRKKVMSVQTNLLDSLQHLPAFNC